MNINGIIPALVTPFDEAGRVDHGALAELVNRLIAQGVNGFYACGSTAECFLLTEQERRAVLETIVKAADGRVPVIAHVGNIGTGKTIELARHAESVGAAAVSSVPPFYFKFTYAEIAGYYEAVSKAVELPLIIYSIPAFSGVEISADNLKPILDACGAKGLKYTAYNLFELEKIHRRFPELKLFNGHDEVTLNALPIGISGAIGSTFNVMAPRFLALLRAFEAGALDEAAALQREINEIIEVMIRVGVNPSIKYWLTRAGIPCGNCRQPFAPIDEDGARLLEAYTPRVLQIGQNAGAFAGSLLMAGA